jgi:toxin ParE1/3/4
MKIVWSPLAIDRVSEIAEYIALDKPLAAANWITLFLQKLINWSFLLKSVG